LKDQKKRSLEEKANYIGIRDFFKNEQAEKIRGATYWDDREAKDNKKPAQKAQNNLPPGLQVRGN